MNRAGVVVASDREGGQDLQRFEKEALEAAVQGRTWVSGVDMDVRGVVGMSFVQPAGHGLSVVARMSMERIWALVDDIDAGPGGFAEVTAADGTLVAAPNKAAVIRGDVFETPRRESPRGLLVVSAPVPSLRWTVYIGQPVSQAFLAVSALQRRSMLLVFIALAVSAALATLVSILHSRPLDALLMGTVRIAEGDFEHRIDVRATDEFGLLSRSFDDMVLRLKERTAALEESERRYRHATESVRDIIFSLDSSGRLSFLNSRVETLLGVQREKLLGRTIDELIEAHVVRFPDGRLAGDRVSGAALPRELHVQNVEGEEVILELEGEGGGSIGGVEFHGIARDVTQRKRIEEKLRRAERLAALGEVASRVAHELRNTVAGITASMEMARARSPAGGRLAADLDLVLSEALRAQDIVQGLLGSARPVTVEKRPCSVNDALVSVMKLRRGRLEAAGIWVTSDLSPSLPLIVADPGHLRQVFHNLIDNAERALCSLPSGAERALRVHTWWRDGRVLVEVSDTGPGIAPQHIGRIFDPLFTTDADNGGTGLGLSVSLAIVEAFGGDIAVRSKPGQGATFTVELPSTCGSAEGAEDLAGMRILVVEDEPAIREFVHHFMESMGCSVDSAADGREAVVLLATGDPYALIISDFKMPDRDGRALYEWIRASRPTLLKRLIYITGDSLNPLTVAFLEQAGIPYLLKPVVASVLATEVRRTLSRASENGGN